MGNEYTLNPKPSKLYHDVEYTLNPKPSKLYHDIMTSHTIYAA